MKTALNIYTSLMQSRERSTATPAEQAFPTMTHHIGP